MNGASLPTQTDRRLETAAAAEGVSASVGQIR
jgi:hypothetical protein